MILFGQTAGPYQHLEQARARAIEEGLPVLRVSNNGISAAIDPYGRILGQIPLGHRGALDVPVAAALAPTFYAENRWLGLIGGLIWLGLLAFLLTLERAKSAEQLKTEYKKLDKIYGISLYI